MFELDDGPHHDHMVCMKTGQVVEFVDEVIEQRQRLGAGSAFQHEEYVEVQGAEKPGGSKCTAPSECSACARVEESERGCESSCSE